MAFSSLGILITASIIIIFVLYSNTPIIRATGRELTHLLLAGCLLCYAVSFFMMITPNKFTCALQRICIGLGFAVMYAPLVTKTNRIYRIFEAASRTTKRPAYVSPRSQIIITAVLIGIQLALSAIWIGFDPPSTRYFMTNPGQLELRCETKNTNFLISLAYNILLIIVCTAYAIKTRHIPENFNESKFIGFTMYTTCIIWLAFIPIYFTTMERIEVSYVTKQLMNIHF
ncbi:unnamed protein product [Protopolystoma xenopodis]|uniref:G-protein coupled receptors family 3 profile domain-containing protein n=1 Tax=Protopolystoma xenopodis TaxID=117903 RepID=A0A3S5FC39_9PLAT|nr:unnamed protein product [Protopolystoma xenopodis]